MYIWDTASRGLLYKLPGHTGSVNEASFHPTQPIIGSASSDKTVGCALRGMLSLDPSQAQDCAQMCSNLPEKLTSHGVCVQCHRKDNFFTMPFSTYSLQIYLGELAV